VHHRRCGLVRSVMQRTNSRPPEAVGVPQAVPISVTSRRRGRCAGVARGRSSQACEQEQKDCLCDFPRRLRDAPERLATGAYILHVGVQKWNGTPEHAAGLHAMAAAAFPFLRPIPPQRFRRLLATGEIATGAALLTPVVPTRVAGAALTAFSGSLLAMYWRTPALHESGSIWPTQAGIAISKDVWMLGIGLGLLAGDIVQEEVGVDDPRHTWSGNARN
jgi:uncharacterized membrane protein YphA (DoxX/SURF4 family)